MQPWRAGALCLALLALTAPAAFAIQQPATPAGHDVLDARAGHRAAVPTATATARTALDRSLGTLGTVSADPVTGGLRDVGRSDGFLTARSASDPAAIGLGYVRDHRAAFGLDSADLAQLRLATSSVSGDGVTHLTWRQSVGGIPAYDSALFANVTADGRLVNAGGAPVHDLAIPDTDPPLGPSAARAAAQRDVGVTPDGDPGDVGNDAVRTTRFADGDQASLVTLADPDGDHLAWKLIVAGRNPYIYEVLVDAASGAILHRASMTEFATNATVLGNHPGAAAGGTAASVTFPSAWLPSSPTSLSGPNAHAYADRTAPDGIGGDSETAPSSGSDFVFGVAPQTPGGGHTCPTAFTAPCTWDGNYTVSGGAGFPTTNNASVTANQSQATTQLFYYVNNYHDWLATDPINFTTGSFNFQGADPVNAEADDYGGLNNANMSTPPDGTSPRMQMYLFSAGFPSVNGADDASVVYHEYTHGLTNRLIGNDGQANGLQTRQSQAMGEAWSDWYAMDYLVAHGLVSDGPSAGDVIVGEYVTNNTNTGIRANALDCPVGGGGAHCPGSANAGPGGFTFADMGRVTAASGNPYFEVHADGEIWAETLWDLRTALGATTARGLITSALRLSPKQPSFLTMRNAILQADLITGATNRAAIWQVFAARGMGYGATTVSGGNGGRGIPSFITPPLAAAGKPDVQSPDPLGDGDAVLEPGEAARVRIPLVNPGPAGLTNVRAVLTTSTAGVVVGTSKANYGSITAGATGAAAAPFAITVPATVPCGTVVALTLTVTSDQGTFQTAPVSLPTGSGSSVATATDVPKSIPDNNRSTPAVSSLTIAAPGRVGHLRVTVSVSHTYVGDLHGYLVSPTGTIVNLFDEIGLGDSTAADGLSAVVFDDDAPTSIQNVPSPDGPAISGSYQPDEPLSAITDEGRAGTWTLRVTDDVAGDAGAITGWSLSTDQPACAATGRALPAAATGTASVGAQSAVLTGSASDADGAFEYGTTADYDTVAPAGAQAADGSINLTIGGLTPGATYHYRALALRDGTVMAVGADQSFTVPPAPAPAAPAPPAPAPTPPPVLKVATIAITKLPTAATADAKGRFTFAFSVPAGTAKSGVTSGTMTLKSAKALRLGKSRKKTILTAATARFTVPANGRITFRVTLTKAARSYLRSHRSVAVKATIKLGATTKLVALTLKAPKKSKKK